MYRINTSIIMSIGLSAIAQITAAVTTLAGLEVDGDDTMREYTTTPTGTTGITVGYTAPHPTENPAPSGGLGRSYLGWKAGRPGSTPPTTRSGPWAGAVTAATAWTIRRTPAPRPSVTPGGSTSPAPS
jgi:hypothetical protein